MSKFKVRDSGEERVEFWLEERGEGAIELMAKGDDGAWQVLDITENGKLHLATSLDAEFLETTDGNRIKITQ